MDKQVWTIGPDTKWYRVYFSIYIQIWDRSIYKIIIDTAAEYTHEKINETKYTQYIVLWKVYTTETSRHNWAEITVYTKQHLSEAQDIQYKYKWTTKVGYTKKNN